MSTGRSLPVLPDRVMVAIVIPCLNEAGHIERCLASIAASSYPKDLLSVRVCDGMSDDGTREIVLRYAADHPYVELLDNPHRSTPQALNIGLQKGGYDVGIILGAHAEVTLDFIERNVEALRRDGTVGCAGGIIENVHENAVSRRIGAAMAHPFGVGNAHFRTGGKAGYVDTVAFGAYRKEVFEAIGFFDEELVRNQDDEFNFRVVQAGFRILLDPAIRSRYYVRASYERLFRQYQQYGFWKVYVNRKHRTLTTWRQLVPALWVLFLGITVPLSLVSNIFLAILLAGVACYLAAAGYSTVKASASAADRPGVLLAFLWLHLGYGEGYLRGAYELLLLRREPGEGNKGSTRGTRTAGAREDEATILSAHGVVGGIALILLCLALSLLPGAVPLLIAITLVAVLFHHRRTEGVRSFPAWSGPLFWSSLLYLLYLVGLLWTTNFDYAWFDLGIKAGMILIPFLAWRIPEVHRIGGEPLLKWFVRGAAVAVVLCISVALWRILMESCTDRVAHGAANLIASRFSLFLHPSYFAVHLCFALAVVLLGPRPAGLPMRWSLPGLLALGVLLCASKVGWAALAVLYVMALAYHWRGPLMKPLFRAGTVLFAVFVISVLLSPFMREKVEQLVRVTQHGAPAPDAEGSSEMRELVWSAGAELFREHPWLGTGTGDVKDELLARYAERGYVHPLALRLNAHSQLLQTPLTVGIVGGVLLYLLLLVPGLAALKRRDGPMLAFVLVLGMNWAVESMLEVQAGVVFLCIGGLLLFLRTNARP